MDLVTVIEGLPAAVLAVLMIRSLLSPSTKDCRTDVRNPILLVMDDGALDHGLLLAFDSDEPAFARGFELGRIWALLNERSDEEVVEHAHASNAEMLLRMAEATGRELVTEDLDDVWVIATYGVPLAVESP